LYPAIAATSTADTKVSRLIELSIQAAAQTKTALQAFNFENPVAAHTGAQPSLFGVFMSTSYTFRKTLNAICALVSFSFGVSGTNAQTTTDGVLLRAPTHEIPSTDIRALRFMLSEKDYFQYIQNEIGVRADVNMLHAFRTYANDRARGNDFTPQEKRYVELVKERAELEAAADIFEARAKNVMKSNDTLLTQRARELYVKLPAESTRPQDLMVVYQEIIVNTTRRDFSETAARIANIYELLAKGSDFTDIVRRFSDDSNIEKTNGVVADVRLGTLEADLGKYLALDINVGDYTKRPFSHRSGIRIVKLLERVPQKRAAFDTLAPALKEQVIAAAGADARKDLLDRYASSPSTSDEAAFAAFIPKVPEEVKRYVDDLVKSQREKAQKQTSKN
jgi:hypothetical protein